MLLDWQVTQMSSLATDLNHFIFSSVDHSVRKKYFDDLLRLYYEEYMEVIKSADLNPNFTFPELKQEFANKNKMGIIMGVCVLPFVSVDEDDLLDLGNLNDENDAKINIQKQGKKLLNLVKERGKFYDLFFGLIDDIIYFHNKFNK